MVVVSEADGICSPVILMLRQHDNRDKRKFHRAEVLYIARPDDAVAIGITTQR